MPVEILLLSREACTFGYLKLFTSSFLPNQPRSVGKNWEGSGALPYLQANKSACPSPMDAGRRHSPPLRHVYTQHRWHEHPVGVGHARPPSPSAAMWNSPSARCTHSGSASQLRNPELRESTSFIMGFKQTHTSFVLKEEVVFIKPDSK